MAGCLAGLALLWPDRSKLPEPLADATRDELVAAEVVAATSLGSTDDPLVGSDVELLSLELALLDGPDAGTNTTLEVTSTGLPELGPGDRVNVARSVLDHPDGSTSISYFLVDFPRTRPLVLLGGLFVLVVLVLGRWLGLRSLVSLAASLVVVTQFVVPALLTGSSPFLVALVGAVTIMVLTLYLTHGVNVLTTAAVVGTTVALTVTVAIGAWAIGATKLTGLTDEAAQQATFAVTSLDVRGLVLAGLIIATLGVLDDVTIAQASTVRELHRTDPTLPIGALAARAMSVGRDHVASTINTLFLAYAGASLATLLVFSTSGLPVAELLTSEIIAEELVKTVVGSLGLMSAVPVTTLLAAVLVRRGLDDGRGHAHAHAHAHVEGGGAPRRSRTGAAAPARPDGEDDWSDWLDYLRTGARRDDPTTGDADTSDRPGDV